MAVGTSVLVAAVVSDGDVSWGDSVVRHLPEFTWPMGRGATSKFAAICAPGDGVFTRVGVG